MRRGKPNEVLPIPGSMAINRGRRSPWMILCQRLFVCWLLSLCLFCVLYWLWKPAEDNADFHLQHEWAAQFDAVADWLWEQVAVCSPRLPQHLGLVAVGVLVNPSFEENLEGWRTLEGSPAVRKELGREGGQNAFWVAQEGSEEGFTCSSQLLDLGDVRKLQVQSGMIVGFVEGREFHSDEEKKLYLFHGLTDDNGVWMNATVSLRKPATTNPRSECGTRNHFCDRNFNDHVWMEIEYLGDLVRGANGQGRNTESRSSLGSLRTMIADLPQWDRFSIAGLLPPHTRSLNIKICSQHRAGMTNDAAADNVAVNFYSIPEEIKGQQSIPCSITKLPMQRETGQGEGKVTIIWETDSYLRTQSFTWGWEPGRTIFSIPVQTTFVDHCHYVHKIEIEYLDDAFDDMLVKERGALFYKVACGYEESELFRYVTPPEVFTYHSQTVESSRIALISDNQYGNQIMRHLAYDIQAFHPDLLLMGGDIVNRGYLLEEWGMYFWYPLEVAQLAQRTPVVITRGNHDGQSGFAFAFTAGVRNRDWFAFSYGSARYIILDSNADEATAPQQLKWLRKELLSKEFDEALFRFVVE